MDPIRDGDTGQPVRVFLLDDHEVVRRGVHDLLDAEPDIEVVGEAGTCAQALARVPALKPRVAVLDGATTASVTAAVNSYMTSAMISGQTVTVSPNPPSGAEYGDPVTVTVSIAFSQVSWLPSPMYLGGKTLTSATVMRRETTTN